MLMTRLLLAMLVVTGCRPVSKSGIHYSGSELMGVEESAMVVEPAVISTATAGEVARRKNKIPGFYNTGIALAGEQGSRLKVGARICVSADYGRANAAGSGNSHETAAKCGRLESCSERDDWLKDLPAANGDLCMRADCLSKSTAGLDMQGELLDDAPCNLSRGRSTAFNVSAYIRDMGTFALNIEAPSVALTEPNSGRADLRLQGDLKYTKTKGRTGRARVTLADETLGDFDLFQTVYENNALATNAGGESSTVTVGNSANDGGAFTLVFAEGGSGTDDVAIGGPVSSTEQVGQSGAEGVVDPGPKPAELGLVKTRQGNTFQLTGGMSADGWLGPAGTVKVFIGN